MKAQLAPYFPVSLATLVQEIQKQKLQAARTALGTSESQLICFDPHGYRTRLELFWNGQNLGIKVKSDESDFEFLKIENPEVAHPSLIKALAFFRAHPLPIPMASLRFRVSSGDRLGLWVDTANIHIKTLLDESQWLETYLENKWVLELGQKGKSPIKKETGLWGLGSQTPESWLETYDSQGNAIAIQSFLSSFTQAGPKLNAAIIRAMATLLKNNLISNVSWMEWGAGNGNLSLALASLLGTSGFVTEPYGDLFELLKINLKQNAPNLKIEAWSIERGLKMLKTLPAPAEVWIMDPPRSGFSKLLSNLEPSIAPKHILILHCHLQGLQNDSEALKSHGFKLKEWITIDAFPGGDQLETLSFWSRS